MSRIGEWDENERALYAVGSRALLDDLERQRREWNESYALDSTSMDEINRAHAARMRQLEEDHKAWLARFLKDASGEADEPAPAQDVAGGQSDRSGPSPASGQGSRQPDPHVAELERAREIADMDMATYAARRAELGVRSATDMSHLFG